MEVGVPARSHASVSSEALGTARITPPIQPATSRANGSASVMVRNRRPVQPRTFSSATSGRRRSAAAATSRKSSTTQTMISDSDAGRMVSIATSLSAAMSSRIDASSTGWALLSVPPATSCGPRFTSSAADSTSAVSSSWPRSPGACSARSTRTTRSAAGREASSSGVTRNGDGLYAMSFAEPAWNGVLT